MKTHSTQLSQDVWRIWITTEDQETYVAETQSNVKPSHYEILDLFETLPVLFKST